MKDLARRPTEPEDMMTLANLAAQLAQLEGGMITLQQYAAGILEAGDQSRLVEPPPLPPATEVEVIEEPEEVEEVEEPVYNPDDDDWDGSIRTKDLDDRSPTYRTSKKRRRSKR
jgi:hypothetical protein